LTIWGTPQLASPSLGARVWQAREVLPWWNIDGVTPAGVCVGAYQAKSAASYLASLVNLANPGTNDLIEGNGAVPWAAGTGWGFVAGNAQWFDTGLMPFSNWSVIIQFTNVATAGTTALFGVRDAPANYYLTPNLIGLVARYTNGNDQNSGAPILSGNLAIAGTQGYHDGIPDSAPMSGFVGAVTCSLYIGARHNCPASVGQHVTADIESIAIYNVTLTAPQVLARANAMAAL
jgi:hypothetical protein